MASRRRHTRFSFCSQLDICRTGQSGWVIARAKNVSVGGVAFETALPVQVGERLKVALSNAEERITTEVIVCHVEKQAGRYVVGAAL